MGELPEDGDDVVEALSHWRGGLGGDVAPGRVARSASAAP